MDYLTQNEFFNRSNTKQRLARSIKQPNKQTSSSTLGIILLPSIDFNSLDGSVNEIQKLIVISFLFRYIPTANGIELKYVIMWLPHGATQSHSLLCGATAAEGLSVQGHFHTMSV